MFLSLFKIQLEIFSVEIPKDIKLSSDEIIECEVVRDQYGFLLHPFIFSSVLQAKPGRTIFAETAIRNHELPVQFPDNVKMEADLISEKIDPSVIAKRRDMRDMPFVTIDGQDAKIMMTRFSLKKNQIILTFTWLSQM